MFPPWGSGQCEAQGDCAGTFPQAFPATHSVHPRRQEQRLTPGLKACRQAGLGFTRRSWKPGDRSSATRGWGPHRRRPAIPSAPPKLSPTLEKPPALTRGDKDARTLPSGNRGRKIKNHFSIKVSVTTVFLHAGQLPAPFSYFKLFLPSFSPSLMKYKMQRYLGVPSSSSWWHASYLTPQSRASPTRGPPEAWTKSPAHSDP